MQSARRQPDLAELSGDALRLRQIVINLVTNAIKFTRVGGIDVHVKLEAADHASCTVRFEIHDTGIGITPDAADRLFEPFTQADGSTTRKYGGTGLGLAICKRLATLMGGEIGLRSEVGRGTTFWFTARLGHQAMATSGAPALVEAAELAR